jgi:hypothetical protein
VPKHCKDGNDKAFATMFAVRRGDKKAFATTFPVRRGDEAFATMEGGVERNSANPIYVSISLSQPVSLSTRLSLNPSLSQPLSLSFSYLSP